MADTDTNTYILLNFLKDNGPVSRQELIANGFYSMVNGHIYHLVKTGKVIRDGKLFDLASRLPVSVEKSDIGLAEYYNLNDKEHWTV